MSMNSVSDLRDTIVPKSDQLNAEQLLGGPITITVTDVRRGGGEEQPVVIHYEGEGGRPYKPCKSMRKILVFAWGADGSQWVGRSMTIYNRPDVKFGGEEVGGIRISHLSHIPKDIAVALTATRGRKEQTRIKKLAEEETVEGSRSRLNAAALGGMKSLAATWATIPRAHKVALGGANGCPDEFKTIANAADAKSGPPKTDDDLGSVDPEAIRERMEAASTLDELNDAFDLVRELDDAELQRELTELYDTRSIDLQ
jgi:hypothetical protein